MALCNCAAMMQRCSKATHEVTTVPPPPRTEGAGACTTAGSRGTWWGVAEAHFLAPPPRYRVAPVSEPQMGPQVGWGVRGTPTHVPQNDRH